MIIAVDAAGGDYAPQEIVKGAIEAAAENNVDIALLGNKSVLDNLLRGEENVDHISTINAEQTISCNEHPVQAVRNKPDSSIVSGINLVRDGTASAFVSAGNTGAVLTAAFLNLKNIEGIDRPALGTVIPMDANRPFLLIDAGANADCQPRFLVQFAHLGNVFAQRFLGIESPRIGLLNNGGEEVKGNSLTKEAYRLLKKTNLNFIGNIEGQEILQGKMDVLVTDGFTGNILLKTFEGFVDYLCSAFRLDLQSLSKLNSDSSLAIDNDHFTSMLKRMDFNEYGGACLLGLRGNVIVAHGRSKARAVKNAIHFAYRTANSKMVDVIQNAVKI